MKKKNLLQTILFILAFVVMNQFTHAQCKSGYVRWCDLSGKHCKCVGFDWCGKNCFRMIDEDGAVVVTTARMYVFPNPVLQSSTIFFSISQSQKVSIKIYDLNGRLIKTIADGEMEDGEHEIEWSATDINAGVYLLQFQSAEFSKMEKLIVTK